MRRPNPQFAGQRANPMPKPLPTRITIDANGSPCKVLSIRIRGKRRDDLLLSFPAARLMRDAGRTMHVSGSRYHRTQLREERYSIHPSRNSAVEMNEIVSHMMLNNGEDLKAHHRTTAIKQDNNFATVFGRRGRRRRYAETRHPKYFRPRKITASPRMARRKGSRRRAVL